MRLAAVAAFVLAAHPDERLALALPSRHLLISPNVQFLNRETHGLQLARDTGEVDWRIFDFFNSFARTQPKLEQPVGVACRTFLHPLIRDTHFLNLLISQLGDEQTGKQLAKQTLQTCREQFTNEAWDQLFDGYRGSWDVEHPAPVDGAVFAEMASWLNEHQAKQPTRDWSSYAHSDAGAYTAKQIQRVASHPSDLGLTFKRVMDFGCGDGIDIGGVAKHFNVAKEDTFGLDVYQSLEEDSKDKVTFLLARVTDAATYEADLTSALENAEYGLKGSVSVVTSSVVFHHVADNKMRTAALGFITDVLEPGGFFLFADWDNHYAIDLTIWYDLVHVLPMLFFGASPLPERPEDWESHVAPLGDTIYRPLRGEQGWIPIIERSGLRFDEQRSEVEDGDAKQQVWRAPDWVADHTPNRNFQVAFFKQAQ